MLIFRAVDINFFTILRHLWSRWVCSSYTQFLDDLVGDTIDKNIKPRDMRSDHQTKSLHYFHLYTYAVRDRIDLYKYEDNPSLPDIAPINTDQLLPSEEEAQNLRSHFAMNIARVLKKHMKFFKQFGSGLEWRIWHEYYAEMSKKSEVVSKCLLCASYLLLCLCNFQSISSVSVEIFNSPWN